MKSRLNISFYILFAFCCFFTTLLPAAASLSLSEEQEMQKKFESLADEPGSVLFQPPAGWLLADPKALPSSVKVMVVGKGTSEYPPSLNLATEKYSGTLKQYLKIIKSINDSRGDEWKDLGNIRTEAGDASLSQVDTKTKWGTERMMHVVLQHKGTIYILTAAALKDEFSKFYKDFFNSFRSLKINKDVYEMIKETSRRVKLQKAADELLLSWKAFYDQYNKKTQAAQVGNASLLAFQNSEFQNKYWKPFITMLERDYADLGPVWKAHLEKTLQNEMIN